MADPAAAILFAPFDDGRDSARGACTLRLAPAVLRLARVAGGVGLGDEQVAAVELATVEVVEERLAAVVCARPVLDAFEQSEARGEAEEGCELLRAGLQKRALLRAGDDAVVHVLA